MVHLLNSSKENQFYFPVHFQDLKFKIYMQCPFYTFDKFFTPTWSKGIPFLRSLSIDVQTWYFEIQTTQFLGIQSLCPMELKQTDRFGSGSFMATTMSRQFGCITRVGSGNDKKIAIGMTSLNKYIAATSNFTRFHKHQGNKPVQY